MPVMKSVLRTMDNISERLANFVSYGLLLIIVVMIYEVVARYAFNRPTLWAEEAVGMLWGAYFILPAGSTITPNTSPKHIRMDLIYNRFSRRKKAIVDLVGSIAFFLFVGVIAWKGSETAWESLMIRERSASVWRPPIYPLKICLAVGTFLFLVQGVARFIRNFTTAFTERGETT